MPRVDDANSKGFVCMPSHRPVLGYWFLHLSYPLSIPNPQSQSHSLGATLATSPIIDFKRSIKGSMTSQDEHHFRHTQPHSTTCNTTTSWPPPPASPSYFRMSDSWRVAPVMSFQSFVVLGSSVAARTCTEQLKGSYTLIGLWVDRISRRII